MDYADYRCIVVALWLYNLYNPHKLHNPWIMQIIDALWVPLWPYNLYNPHNPQPHNPHNPHRPGLRFGPSIK